MKNTPLEFRGGPQSNLPNKIRLQKTSGLVSVALCVFSVNSVKKEVGLHRPIKFNNIIEGTLGLSAPPSRSLLKQRSIPRVASRRDVDTLASISVL